MIFRRWLRKCYKIFLPIQQWIILAVSYQDLETTEMPEQLSHCDVTGSFLPKPSEASRWNGLLMSTQLLSQVVQHDPLLLLYLKTTPHRLVGWYLWTSPRQCSLQDFVPAPPFPPGRASPVRQYLSSVPWASLTRTQNPYDFVSNIWWVLIKIS